MKPQPVVIHTVQPVIYAQPVPKPVGYMPMPMPMQPMQPMQPMMPGMAPHPHPHQSMPSYGIAPQPIPAPMMQPQPTGHIEYPRF
eukprot:gnl/Chilomastix_caulleri/190.p2 GENE.gnl/Chilomastix_caulleri/190~~gnl/Chilomastix_caulleri/190.p2  ORF type:complete len:85 (+),score=46.19 gnl/Chilomastix_caulleri/190:570-824(+)